ncbi:MAG: PAS domain-containing sensor histidine kinase [Acidimicrobiales bacterium]
MADTVPSPAALLPPSQLWDAAPDAMVLVDETGRIRAANLASEHLFKHSVETLVAMSVEELVPVERRGRHISQRERYDDNPTRRPMGQGRRLDALRADGTVVPVQISLSPITTVDGDMTIAAVRDVSDWLAAEERASLANRRRLIAEDHDRIARELHDTVIQELFALGMGLEAVAPEIPAGPVSARIDRSIDTIDRVITEIRSAIFGLQHAPGDDHLLHGEIHSVADLLQASLGFDPKVCIEGPLESLPSVVADHVVPTIREALANVARHASATEATVAVVVEPHRLRVEVRDDGVGFTSPPSRRSGLENMERRAALLGGESSISCSPDEGTVLRWSVPLGTDA